LPCVSKSEGAACRPAVPAMPPSPVALPSALVLSQPSVWWLRRWAALCFRHSRCATTDFRDLQWERHLEAELGDRGTPDYWGAEPAASPKAKQHLGKAAIGKAAASGAASAAHFDSRQRSTSSPASALLI
jgi:hypothetical protein